MRKWWQFWKPRPVKQEPWQQEWTRTQHVMQPWARKWANENHSTLADSDGDDGS